MTTTEKCPVCGGGMKPRQAQNSLSRVMSGTYICNDCGNREAMLDMRSNAVVDRRICLYQDAASGIMLVTEDEPGYEPFGRRPPSEQFAEEYCTAWNTAIGITDEDQSEILASSMFRRWAHF